MVCTTALSWLFLTASAVAASYKPPAYCTRPPYLALNTLSEIPIIASYCSAKYPLPVVTSTGTAPALTTTVFVATTTRTITVKTETITKTANPETTTVATTTLTSTTTETSITTTTVDYTAPPLGKRSLPTPAADLLRFFLERGASVVKTACSCLQTPRTTRKTVTPTLIIRATSTVQTGVTDTVFTTTTPTVSVTATARTTVTQTSTSTVTEQCAAAVPTACSGQCVATQTDNDHCGACGRLCDTNNGQFCSGGACVSILACNNPGTCGAFPACGAPSCNGVCVPDAAGGGKCRDLQSGLNCGALQSRQCTSNDQCPGGYCTGSCCPFLACRYHSENAFCPNRNSPSRLFRQRDANSLVGGKEAAEASGWEFGAPPESF